MINMKGVHRIAVRSRYMNYDFELRRNITIIQGNSATGKTTLVDMLREYMLNGEDSGITVISDKPIRIIEGNTWVEQLSFAKDCIVFIDEGNKFIGSKDFATAINGSSNFFVLITRESLDALPYSVEEIYGIKSSGKYGGLEPVYHEFYRIYNNKEAKQLPDQIVVEDTNSGYEFFRNIASDKYIACVSAGGKGNIFNILNDTEPKVKQLVIADGAAFGSQMNKVTQLAGRRKNIQLYLPESFEWLILKSGVVKDHQIVKILGNTCEYIESSKWFSWERYFTDLLVETSKDGYLRYTKKKLNPNYLQDNIKNKILDVMGKVNI